MLLLLAEEADRLHSSACTFRQDFVLCVRLSQAAVSYHCSKYIRHGNVWRRLAFVELLVLFSDVSGVEVGGPHQFHDHITDIRAL